MVTVETRTLNSPTPVAMVTDLKRSSRGWAAQPPDRKYVAVRCKHGTDRNAQPPNCGHIELVMQVPDTDLADVG